MTPTLLLALACAPAGPPTPAAAPAARAIPPSIAIAVGAPLVQGETATIVVAGAGDGERVWLAASLDGAGAGPCSAAIGDRCLGLAPPLRGPLDALADGGGRATFTFDIPSPGVDRALALQAFVVRGPDGEDTLVSPVREEMVHVRPPADPPTPEPGTWEGWYTMGPGEADAASLVVDSDAPYSVLRDVAFPGDVNGDGIGDILVGGTQLADGRGSVFLIHGPLSGTLDVELEAHAIWVGADPSGTLLPPEEQNGDLDGDGFADVLIEQSSSPSVNGELFIRYGGAGREPHGPASAADTTEARITRSVEDNEFVGRLTSDLTEDGLDDLLLYELGGSSFIVPGPIRGDHMVGNPGLASTEIDGEGQLRPTPGVGDYDGDGLPDLWVSQGSDEHDDVANEYVFLAPFGPILMDHDADWRFYNDGRIGKNAMGDYDGDGSIDVVFWTPDTPLVVAGRPPPGPTYIPDYETGRIVDESDVFGYHTAPDIDGDGRDEIMARMPFLSTVSYLTESLEGTVSVLDDASAMFFAPLAGHELAIGDVTGDGRADLIVSSGLDVWGYGEETVHVVALEPL